MGATFQAQEPLKTSEPNSTTTRHDKKKVAALYYDDSCAIRSGNVDWVDGFWDMGLGQDDEKQVKVVVSRLNTDKFDNG